MIDDNKARDITVSNARRHTLAAASMVALKGSTTAGEMAKVVGLLTHADPIVRQGALRTLATVRGLEAMRAITGRLNDKAGQVRATACEILGHMRAHQAKTQLYDALNDTDPIVVCYAAEALGKMGDRVGLPNVKKLLFKRGNHQRLALKCINFLEGKQYELSEKGLKKALNQSTPPKKRRFFSIN